MTDEIPVPKHPETLAELHERPWSDIEGAYLRVAQEVDDNDFAAPATEYDASKLRVEEREGELVGREIGTGLYFDSGRGELVTTRIGPAVYLDTPEDTTLEVSTDKLGNELLEYTPP